jgi:hypothetical protein
MTIAADSVPPQAPEALVAGRRPPWDGRDVVIALLILLALITVVPLPIVGPLLVLYGEDSQATLIPAVLVSGLVYVGIIAVAARLSFGKYGGGWERLGVGRITWPVAGWAVATLVAVFAVSAAYSGVISWLDIDALRQGECDQVPSDIRDQRIILVLTSIIAVLFAPAAEELFYRGFVFPGLAKMWGVPAGIVASGVLFSLSHLVGNPLLWKTAILFALIGIIFAFSYHRTGNIFTTIFAHAGFNLLGVIVIASTTCE